ADRFSGVEISFDPQKRPALLECFAVDRRGPRNRFVDGAHRAVSITERGARLREACHGMWHLQRRNVQFTRELHRALRLLDSSRSMAKALFEHRTKVVEEGPLHPARR